VAEGGRSQCRLTVSNRIDAILDHSPHTKGKAVGRGYRLLVEVPLAVLFTVDQKAHEVIIHEVRYYPLRLNGAVQRR
jgi:hypothetical protein